MILVAMLLAVCHYNGALADPACTPGKADPSVTQANVQQTICRPGYSSAHRSVSQATKARVVHAYGMTGNGCGTRCEIDHLISIELGGSNEIENLSPEMYAPVPGAHQKDLVENHLHAEVCAGRLSLADAQHGIATDWLSIYTHLSSGQRATATKRR